MDGETSMPLCDLLCHEDADRLISVDSTDRHGATGGVDLDSGVSIAELIGGESDHSPSAEYPSRLRSERRESVAWIRKVQDYYRMQPVTAYLAVNYLDRFLSTHSLPKEKGWPLPLLSVTCLSLAAKMEETQIPSLIHLQEVEGTRFIFNTKTIFRMELLVLSSLKWRLRAVTPFSFITFFAFKVDPRGLYLLYLASRAAEIILSAIADNHFLKQCPLSMAAAAIILATSEEPVMAFEDPEKAVSWCIGLSRIPNVF